MPRKSGISHISEENRTKLGKALLQGLTNDEISHMFGWTNGTTRQMIYTLRKHYGFDFKRPKVNKTVPSDLVEKVRQLRNKGETLESIAFMLGVSNSKIFNITQDFKIPKPDCIDEKKEYREKVFLDYINKKISAKDGSLALNITLQTFHNAIARYRSSKLNVKTGEEFE